MSLQLSKRGQKVEAAASALYLQTALGPDPMPTAQSGGAESGLYVCIKEPRALCSLAVSGVLAAGSSSKTRSEIPGLSQIYKRGVSPQESLPFCPETKTFQNWEGHLD